MHRTHIVAFLSVLLLATAAATASSRYAAGQPGDVAPDWKDLPGTDGKLHSLKDLAEFDVVVVCFTCNTCPYAVDYEQRLQRLHEQFVTENTKAVVVAINANATPDDSLQKMKQRAAERGLTYLYLKDETQDTARAYDAVYTPEFYVLNKERRIVYRGAMDDSTNAAKVTKHFVADAVQAALQGKKPAVEKSGARGCTIRYQRRRR